MITRRKLRIRHCWSKWFLEINGQTYDLTLVMHTETIVFFLGNKIKFCPAVPIFGSRSMIALFTPPQFIGSLSSYRYPTVSGSMHVERCDCEGKLCCLFQNTRIRIQQWQRLIFDQRYCWAPTAQGYLQWQWSDEPLPDVVQYNRVFQMSAC